MKFVKQKILISRLALLLNLALLINCSEIQAQSVNNNTDILMPKITELIMDYQKYGQFTSNGVSLDEDYINRYRDLFDLKEGIYNDLSFSSTGSFSSIERYILYARQFYSQGLDITIDTDKLIIEESSKDLNGYKVRLLVRKELVGLYSQKKIHRFEGNLYFYLTVAANSQGIITSIRINGVLSTKQFTRSIQDKKEKGLYVSATGAFAMTRIYNSNLYNESSWTASTGKSIHPSLAITYMFNRNAGITGGIKFSTFKTSFAIRNYSNTSNQTMTDIDGETYQPVLTISSLTQSNHVNCFDIPFLVKLNSGNQKTKFYFHAGIILSFFVKSNFTLDGDLVKAGYYSQYGMTIEDIPEYGFGSLNYSSTDKYTLKMPSYNLSGYFSLGLTRMIKPGLSLMFGVSRTLGLTDLGFNQNIPENYINYAISNPLKRTILQSTNIEIGIIYKISDIR